MFQDVLPQNSPWHLRKQQKQESQSHFLPSSPEAGVLKPRRAGGVAQVVEYLPSKHKSPEFKPQYHKIKK
jgi:hypothetical protein